MNPYDYDDIMKNWDEWVKYYTMKGYEDEPISSWPRDAFETLLEALFYAPRITVDAIVELGRGIVLIKRKNPPYGWALPGGFVDYGESLEDAVIREVKEEISLDVKIVDQFHTYSKPDRDPRHHIISTVFVVRAEVDFPKAADDAKEVEIWYPETMPFKYEMAFDHYQILEDYFKLWRYNHHG